MTRRHVKPTVTAEQAAEAYRRAFPELESAGPGCRCVNCEPPLARRILGWQRDKTGQRLSLTGACRQHIGSLRARKRPAASTEIPRNKRS